MLEVCVVIPTFHEEKNIVKLIPVLFNTYKNIKIVIVDDSLNNLTIEAVNKLQSTYSNLFYIDKYYPNCPINMTGGTYPAQF